MSDLKQTLFIYNEKSKSTCNHNAVLDKNIEKNGQGFIEWLETTKSRKDIITAAKTYEGTYWLIQAYFRHKNNAGTEVLSMPDIYLEEALIKRFHVIAARYK